MAAKIGMQKILRVLKEFFFIKFFLKLYMWGFNFGGLRSFAERDDRYAVVPTLEQKRLFGWMENLFLSFGLCYL